MIRSGCNLGLHICMRKFASWHMEEELIREVLRLACCLG
jgi:hypothetical protein